MATINKPYEFSPNTTASASEVNDNFDTIYNEFNGSISAANLASNAVTTAKITDSNVTTAKIADSNVTTAKIADSNVTTAKIADANVTNAKLATGTGEPGGAWQDWTANPAGFSSTTVNDTRYKVVGKMVTCRVSISGTSNATTFTFTLPTTSVNDGQTNYYLVRGKDSGSATAVTMIQISANSSTATVFATVGGGAWTASGTKILDGAVFTYETA